MFTKGDQLDVVHSGNLSGYHDADTNDADIETKSILAQSVITTKGPVENA